MSLKLDGQVCPVCHAYLFDDDDVVYCPECGAPHHRDCYNSIGHCGLQNLHGTPEQYDSSKSAVKETVVLNTEQERKFNDQHTEILTSCRMCGERYDPLLKTCPKCGAPNIARMGSPFASFDFLGGIPADYNIGDGVTADEAKRFVISNTPRYVQKFAALNPKNKISWNWFAFLFPCGWFLSRKMYKSGIIAGILKIAATLLSIPLSRILYASGATDATTYTEIFDNMASLLPDIGKTVLVFAGISLLFGLIIRTVCAMIGDYKYKCYTVSSIVKIKAESDDIDFDFHKKGGVNFFALIIGVLAVEYLPGIISTFL